MTGVYLWLPCWQRGQKVWNRRVVGARNGTLSKGEVVGGSRVRFCHAKNRRHEFSTDKRGCPGLSQQLVKKGVANAVVRDLLLDWEGDTFEQQRGLCPSLGQDGQVRNGEEGNTPGWLRHAEQVGTSAETFHASHHLLSLFLRWPLTLRLWKYHKYKSIYRWRECIDDGPECYLHHPPPRLKKAHEATNPPPGWVTFSLCGQRQAWAHITRTSKTKVL